ncbi:tRNA pseudouridine(38-40) synthase TruA [Anaerotalea alkaliphila]|uniref:tRNA pseudouridine synthase A n=1 Tax=Anaerotalea alkaliphila TaxID=2662126 RepID=A0A7X5KMM8_9FIRM|nr:tRNA pseudouridine(38-40) synthase TruA [Anaerotalea alkaliphila]NDL68146.1 tRNA pseudouridine(38-40) synthase TruA [Anaerotalea alkaliphila]
MGLKLTVAYDGTRYAGWQVQKNGYTVQEAMMRAGKNLFPGPFTITGASRTDAGVHALGQVALLEAETSIPAERIPFAFNRFLPPDIVVQRGEPVEEGFHPRYTPHFKTYSYQIHNAPVPLPQNRRYAHHMQKALDVERMAGAAGRWVGTHDFKAFCSAKAKNKEDTVRTVYAATVKSQGNLLEFQVTGNGFLYNMVRIMAGTLLEVGTGAMAPEAMDGILISRDRDKAGPTAPAHGLTLVEIVYAPYPQDKESKDER